jgi:hypothetical protein
MTPATGTIEQFRTSGFAVVRNLIGGELLMVAYGYASLKAGIGLFTSARGDAQVPGVPGQYADPLMEVLLARCAARLSKATGCDLLPTYSYCRVYGAAGNVLKRHRDRPECEITASVCLGYEGPQPSPLYLQGPSGGLKCVMYPGDAIVYRGCDIEHWREAWAGERQAQVFFHYVDRHGPNGHLIYDRRPGLGLPAASR